MIERWGGGGGYTENDGQTGPPCVDQAAAEAPMPAMATRVRAEDHLQTNRIGGAVPRRMLW